MEKSRTGFTLIELLVVIAIIAILAAILFPVLTAAKETARLSTCANNMRQLGTAFSMYVDDSNGRYPASSKYTNPQFKLVPFQYPGVITWDLVIYKYVKNINVFHCPDDAYPRPKIPGWNYKPYPRSYSMNDQMYTENSPVGFSQGEMRPCPSRYILLTEWYPGFTQNGKLTTAPNANDFSYHWYNACPVDRSTLDAMHKAGNSSNFLFFDGHVVSAPPRKFADVRWWNYLPGKGSDKKI